ncbi:hypothetical protein Tco_1351172 [Tanacetum coccineum]
MPTQLPDDPYVAVRQAHLVDMDTESEPEEAPSEIEEYQPLVSRAPLTDEEFEVSEPSNTRITSSHSLASSDSTVPLSPDHPLTQTSPTPTPTRVSFHRRTARMAVRTQPTLSPSMSARIAEATALSPSSFQDTKDESSDSDTEREGSEGEGHSSEDEGPGTEEEEEEEDALEVSPSPLVVPSPIASPVTTLAATISVDDDQFLKVGAHLELHGSILHDHTQRLDALPPTLFEGYDRDLWELYTRSGAVRDEIFSQRYRFRSLEWEQERATVTFNAIWRPVLALEAWAGQTDSQRAALWHAIYDIQRVNHDLRMQIAEERHERLELTDHVARIERRQESRGE